jgi:folate-dependent phosphoribosylglycinamide formyltransferase PurN
MNIVVLTNGEPHHRYVVNAVHRRHPVRLVLVRRRSLSSPAPRIRRAYWAARDWMSEANRGGWRALRRRRFHRKLLRRERWLKQRAWRAELGVTEDLPFEASLPVEFVDDLHADRSVRLVDASRPDLLLLMGCAIIRPPLLTLPRLGALNCHSSRLPAFRGAAPEHWILLTGRHDGAGVTVHWADERVDAGNIVAQRSVPVFPGDDPFRLRCRSAALLPRLLVDVLGALCEGRPRGTPQDAGGTAYRAEQLTPELRWKCCLMSQRCGPAVDAQVQETG